MDYKRGDRYSHSSKSGGLIYEYLGDDMKCVILETWGDCNRMVGEIESWPVHADKFIGNFDKSRQFKEIYDILNEA